MVAAGRVARQGSCARRDDAPERTGRAGLTRRSRRRGSMVLPGSCWHPRCVCRAGGGRSMQLEFSSLGRLGAEDRSAVRLLLEDAARKAEHCPALVALFGELSEALEL